MKRGVWQITKIMVRVMVIPGGMPNYLESSLHNKLTDGESNRVSFVVEIIQQDR